MSNLLHIKEPKVGFPYRRHRHHQFGLLRSSKPASLPFHPTVIDYPIAVIIIVAIHMHSAGISIPSVVRTRRRSADGVITNASRENIQIAAEVRDR